MSMRNGWSLLLSTLVVVLGLGGSVFAGSINVSTGLDSSDNLILSGNVNDAHWTVDQPLGGIAPAKVSAPGFPGFTGVWLANGPASNWITIDPNQLGNAPVVPYSYYRTFTLSAADAANAMLTALWGIDDGGEVRLNGNVIATSPGNYTMTATANVAAGSGLFVAGLNTLEIKMTNSDNFLEAVRLQGVVTVVPEPSTLAIAATGVVFAVSVRRRSRRS